MTTQPDTGARPQPHPLAIDRWRLLTTTSQLAMAAAAAWRASPSLTGRQHDGKE